MALLITENSKRRVGQSIRIVPELDLVVVVKWRRREQPALKREAKPLDPDNAGVHDPEHDPRRDPAVSGSSSPWALRVNRSSTATARTRSPSPSKCN